MLATTFVLAAGLCQPALGQSVIHGGDATCSNRQFDNILVAYAKTKVNTSYPGHVIYAYLTSYDWHLDCTNGSQWGSGCQAAKEATAGNEALARGISTGLMTGKFDFRYEHRFDGTVMGSFPDSTICPTPPPPTACTGSTCGNSPIIVPIENGNHVKLSSVEQGVPFDINGDGVLEVVAWPEEPESVGFLAMDRDGNGLITSGKELFGDSTVEGAPTGFHALITLPSEPHHSSLKLGRDAGFDSLLLWFDTNRDGVGQGDELRPASEYITEISLNAVMIGKKDQHGNEFKYQGWMRLAEKPEEKRPVYDVFLRVQQ